MGNALVDVLAKLPKDDILETLGLKKGGMTLVDGNQLDAIRQALQDLECQLCVGGCAGNMVRAFSLLGGQAGFIGAVGADFYGGFYRESLLKSGISSHLFVIPDKATGVASTFISRDTERTFGTHLGAALCMNSKMLSEGLFRGYDYLFIEGYLVQDHELILSALQLARKSGTRICLDLASGNVVAEDLDFFRMLVERYVDTVFANENEAFALTGEEPLKAARTIGEMCSLAVVKMGPKGSVIVSGPEVLTVEACPVAHVVDTTGAGDCYAAGFIYGLTRNCSLRTCALIGGTLASSVIQVVGTRLDERESTRLIQLIESYIQEDQI